MEAQINTGYTYKSLAPLCYNVAYIYSEVHNKKEKAKEYYEKTLTIDPNYQDALHNLALLKLNPLLENGNFKEYINNAEVFFERGFKHAEVFFIVGGLYSQQFSKINKAKEYYKKALEQDPNHHDGNINYSRLLLNEAANFVKKGKKKKVISLYQEALICVERANRLKPTEQKQSAIKSLKEYLNKN